MKDFDPLQMLSVFKLGGLIALHGSEWDTNVFFWHNLLVKIPLMVPDYMET